MILLHHTVTENLKCAASKGPT